MNYVTNMKTMSSIKVKMKIWKEDDQNENKPKHYNKRSMFDMIHKHDTFLTCLINQKV